GPAPARPGGPAGCGGHRAHEAVESPGARARRHRARPVRALQAQTRVKGHQAPLSQVRGRHEPRLAPLAEKEGRRAPSAGHASDAGRARAADGGHQKGGATMNELGREVLVAAAMRGVRQIRGALWDSLGGRCAQGVLVEAAVEALNARRSWWQRRDAAFGGGHWRGLTYVTRRGRSIHLPSLYGMSD